MELFKMLASDKTQLALLQERREAAVGKQISLACLTDPFGKSRGTIPNSFAKPWLSSPLSFHSLWRILLPSGFSVSSAHSAPASRCLSHGSTTGTPSLSQVCKSGSRGLSQTSSSTFVDSDPQSLQEADLKTLSLAETKALSKLEPEPLAMSKTKSLTNSEPKTLLGKDPLLSSDAVSVVIPAAGTPLDIVVPQNLRQRSGKTNIAE